MKGTSASAGIGIGKAAIVEETELVIKKETISDAAAEKERFQAALKQAMEETEALAKDLATRVGEKEAEILNGHLMLLSDPMLTGEIEKALSATAEKDFVFAVAVQSHGSYPSEPDVE